jgi:hypothetical protein
MDPVLAKDQSLGRSIGLACFKLKLHPPEQQHGHALIPLQAAWFHQFSVTNWPS